jgi:hypothetical protein
LFAILIANLWLPADSGGLAVKEGIEQTRSVYNYPSPECA